MPATGGGGGERASGAASDAQGEPGSVSYLDHGLWQRLRDATSTEAFVEAWPTLQCRTIGEVSHAVVVLGEPDTAPWYTAPVAFWPRGQGCAPGLANAAEMATAERRGVIRRDDADAEGGGPGLGRWLAGYAVRRAERLVERMYAGLRHDLLRYDREMNRMLAFSGRGE